MSVKDARMKDDAGQAGRRPRAVWQQCARSGEMVEMFPIAVANRLSEFYNAI